MKTVKVKFQGETYEVEFGQYFPMGARVFWLKPEGVKVYLSPHGLDEYYKDGKLYFKQSAVLYGPAYEMRQRLLEAIIEKAKAL